MDVIILLLTLAWLAFWLLNYVFNGRWWIWEFWSAVPGWFWGASWVVLFIPAVLTQNIVAVISLLYTVPLWWPCLDINFSTRKVNSQSKTVKLFNWNTEHWTETAKPDFYKFLQSQHADVYHLQEAWTRDLVIYDAKKELQPYFPDYQIFQNTELVTLTRLKVVDTKMDPKAPILRVDVDIDGKIITFYNVHISVHFIPRYVKQSVAKFFTDAKRRFGLRVKEYIELDRELSSNPNPFVVSGDFNTTTFMRKIRPFLRKYRDAFRSVKRGFATTWYGAFSLRWWRIDYIFGQQINYSSYQVVNPQNLSDHWGQLVEVSA